MSVVSASLCDHHLSNPVIQACPNLPKYRPRDGFLDSNDTRSLRIALLWKYLHFCPLHELPYLKCSSVIVLINRESILCIKRNCEGHPRKLGVIWRSRWVIRYLLLIKFFPWCCPIVSYLGPYHLAREADQVPLIKIPVLVYELLTKLRFLWRLLLDH